jgi:hypothetical protein
VAGPPLLAFAEADVGGADALAESVIRPTSTRVSSGILSDSEIQKRAQKGESWRFPGFGQESSKLMSIIGRMSDVNLIGPVALHSQINRRFLL